MKLSLINKSKSDQGVGFCCDCIIRLDGITLTMCVEADEEKGYVIVHATNGKGELIQGPFDTYDMIVGDVQILHGDHK